MTTVETTLQLQRDEAVRGWLFYDGECPLCGRIVKRIAPALRRRSFRLATFQTAWVRERLAMQPGDPMAEMKLLLTNGKIFDGADAQVQIAKAVWWLWPLFAFAQLPGAMRLLRANYRWTAANRYCISNVCFRPKPVSRRHASFFEI